MVTNATIEALLGRRSIRKFKDEAIDDDTRATLETVAQHAASSQFLKAFRCLVWSVFTQMPCWSK
ncbi:hypothetical protein EK13BL_06700 [Bifidobacterium longum subsp. longum EK13]|nr:hypothetical protein EK13BL_06700 [Bifidobacterium longum subsp. longum EK13]